MTAKAMSSQQRVISSGATRNLRRDLLESIIAVLSIVLVFSGLDYYLPLAVWPSAQPAFVVGPLIVLGLICWPRNVRSVDLFRWTLIGWCVFYLLVSAFGFLLSARPDEAFAILRLRIFCVAYFVCIQAAFATHRSYRLALAATVLMTVWSTGLNIYEWFYPLTFSASAGRSAGFYMNPNASGAAILMAFALTFSFVRKNLRGLWVAVAGLGIVLTFSRGVLVAFAATVLVFQLFGKSMGRLVGLAVFGAVTIALAAVMMFSTAVNHQLQGYEDQKDSYSRVMGADAYDLHSDPRTSAALAGLDLFAETPLFGAGLGSTTVWQLGLGTHNMYVMHLAEHGLLGLALFPLLALLFLARGWKYRADPSHLAFAIAFAAWGFMSHNALEEFQTLTVLALAASAPVNAPDKQAELVARFLPIAVSSPARR